MYPSVKQQNAVRFCEDVLDIVFKGDINKGGDVDIFLNKYFHRAKETAKLSRELYGVELESLLEGRY